ncbi:MAG: methyltransferase [Bacteroidetes bacterium]|jgi:hypothetical protein|nr:methyltransferase [Bacteroidota bacterium]
MEPKSAFLQNLQESLSEGTFVKLTLSKPGRKGSDLKNVYARLVELKGETALSFTLRYATKDETKNHPIAEALGVIDLWLGEDFLNADLFTTQADISLQYNRKRKARLFRRKPTHEAPPARSHDKPKQYFIEPKGNAYLHAMGITSANGKVKADGQRKFRQINKYIEIVDSLLQQHGNFPQQPHIVDMGSGKGYLTFALYDHLLNNRKQQPTITGIELRDNLVDFCNTLAPKAGFTGLQFVAQDIFEYQPARIDMLIALHACDIATDIAIAKGVDAGAEIIIVAPCCHKQVRKAMQATDALQPMLRHGILQERQAELVTDGLRALLMEEQGYDTKVFEFVSTAHTPKNLMIVGIKGNGNPRDRREIDRIKADFGVSEHYLERLLLPVG